MIIPINWLFVLIVSFFIIYTLHMISTLNAVNHWRRKYHFWKSSYIRDMGRMPDGVDAHEELMEDINGSL